MLLAKYTSTLMLVNLIFLITLGERGNIKYAYKAYRYKENAEKK